MDNNYMFSYKFTIFIFRYFSLLIYNTGIMYIHIMYICIHTIYIYIIVVASNLNLVWSLHCRLIV